MAIPISVSNIIEILNASTMLPGISLGMRHLHVGLVPASYILVCVCSMFFHLHASVSRHQSTFLLKLDLFSQQICCALTSMNNPNDDWALAGLIIASLSAFFLWFILDVDSATLKVKL